MPLSLHGVIVRADGEKGGNQHRRKRRRSAVCGDRSASHLGREQSKRPLSEGIKGEELNILLGSRPFNSDPESERVKLNIINILNEKYGITDKDFVTAELEAVPPQSRLTSASTARLSAPTATTTAAAPIPCLRR